MSRPPPPMRTQGLIYCHQCHAPMPPGTPTYNVANRILCAACPPASAEPAPLESLAVIAAALLLIAAGWLLLAGYGPLN